MLGECLPACPRRRDQLVSCGMPATYVLNDLPTIPPWSMKAADSASRSRLLSKVTCPNATSSARGTLTPSRWPASRQRAWGRWRSLRWHTLAGLQADHEPVQCHRRRLPRPVETRPTLPYRRTQPLLRLSPSCSTWPSPRSFRCSFPGWGDLSPEPAPSPRPPRNRAHDAAPVPPSAGGQPGVRSLAARSRLRLK